MNASATAASAATESGVEYARRIHAERVAAGYCPKCWGHGTVVVPYYSHSCGVETDRVVICPTCKGAKKAVVR